MDKMELLFGVRDVDKRQDNNKTSLTASLVEEINNVPLCTAIVLMAFIIIIGCIGNVMVILAVKRNKKLQTVSNIFIINLSVSDLIFVSCVLPFNIYTYFNDGWHLDNRLCKFVGFLGYMLTGTTIITIIEIAYNRYKLVVDMHSYTQFYSRTNIIILLAMTWIVPILFLIPAITDVWGKFGYVPMMVTCNLLLDHDSQMFKIFLLVARTGLSSILIVYFYIRIFFKTRHSHKRIMSVRPQQLTSLEISLMKKEMHLTRMMVTIFAVFAVSYFPCTITGMIDWNHVMSKTFHMFCAITVYISSAANPIVYGLLNHQFRKAYMRMICCTCNKKTYTLQHDLDSPKKKLGST